MKTRTIELLAPAKNSACGFAAIDHGADAVYIGGPLFGARAAATNSLADIADLVTYAHRFRAKVYVTVNTLLENDELEQAVALCHQLYELGVDALIIQDLGLFASDLPPIPLHSSTQMNNRTVEKVQFLEQIGFSQVVLARELSLAQIKTISSVTSLPLEFFVHGALCVAYSGQCYISEVLAGRSANRGECAQFCRHMFTLKDNTDKTIARDRYLLSMKDLNLSNHLADLIDAGISSFKIEGRLKDEKYVKNVTAAYRLALDRIIDSRQDLVRVSSGRCHFSFAPDPDRSFNRGQTDYFLTTPRNAAAEIRTPKSIGKRLGRVATVDAASFTIEGKATVHNGDGLCFFHPQNGLVGLRVNRVEGRNIYPKDGMAQLHLTAGSELFRNADIHFAKLLQNSTRCRKIAVRMLLDEIAEGLQLTLTDEDSIVSKTTLAVAKEQAVRKGSVASMAVRQLKKSGDTDFSVQEVVVELDPGLYFPSSIFNALRRKACACHVEERLGRYTFQRKQRKPNTFPWPSIEVDYTDNITNDKAADFYRHHGVRNIDSALIRAHDIEGCALMTTKYCIKSQLGLCLQLNKRAAVFEEPLTLTDNSGTYTLGFNCLKCEMTVARKESYRKKRGNG
jgi:23S rRNA 5-hydroxycytidine C2501 synthase